MRGRLLKFGRIKIAAAIVVLGALAGGGVAWATAGGNDEIATGPGADRARAAALAHVGKGRVVGVERESKNWEVEIARPDGSVVEVALDARYQVVSAADEEGGDQPGEDERGENENEANEANDD